MSVIWTQTGPYKRVDFNSEADLETSVIKVQDPLFGPGRIYLGPKKKIGDTVSAGDLRYAIRQPFALPSLSHWSAPLPGPPPEARFALPISSLRVSSGRFWRRPKRASWSYRVGSIAMVVWVSQ
jgi:hypothetical protein